MPIIKLDAINSTNKYLKDLMHEEILEDFTVIMANKQTEGKGQMGAVWSSEASKNLTFSVFIDSSKFNLHYPFYLSIATSLAIRSALYGLLVPKLQIKWPNDILSQNKKICGILIENVIKQGRLKASVIGIGLNVNQTFFKGLPNASSLKLITGNVFNLDEILDVILSNLKRYFVILKDNNNILLKNEYESYLFRKNKPSTFRDVKGHLFLGYITAVLDTGDIVILLEDNITKAFSLKDITLLY